MLIKKKYILFIIIFFTLLLQANFAFALEIYYPPLPGIGSPQSFQNSSPEILLTNYVKYLVYLCMWTAGIIALLALAVGGIKYILSTGNPDKLSNAKEQIVSAFFGLLILLSAITVLNIINPDLTILSLKPLEEIKVPDKDPLGNKPINYLQSTIDPEVSFGRAIEKLFETYISEYPAPKEEEEWIPRVIRIKNRALAANEIVTATYSIAAELYNAATDCGCENTNVKPGKECSAGNCIKPPYTVYYECTCDPCEKSRSTIIKSAEYLRNIVYIGEGINITNQKNKDWEIETIKNTTLRQEIKRQEEELRLLKEQFDRVERARKYIEDCPLNSLYSYVQILRNKQIIENIQGELRITDFWNDVDIIYNRPIQIKPRYNPIPYDKQEMEYIYDYATFYCDVSGTVEQSIYSTIAISGVNDKKIEDITEEMSDEEVEEIMLETYACSKEAPFGDYLDRVERTTKLLISRFEEIVNLEKEFIDRIDKLQEAVSQCSSTNCYHECYEIPETGICYDNQCQGDPCPDDVKEEFVRIMYIKERIDFLVNGKQGKPGYLFRLHKGGRYYWMPPEEVDYTDPKNVGIMQILDIKIPTLLKDLEEIIRHPMKECYFEDLEKKGTSLLNCSQSKGGVNPKGEVIYYCCQTEDQNGTITSAGKCYEECYLKDSWKIHRDCVYDCLMEQGTDELPYCMHELNFYCCNIGED